MQKAKDQMAINCQEGETGWRMENIGAGHSHQQGSVEKECGDLTYVPFVTKARFLYAADLPAK